MSDEEGPLGGPLLFEGARGLSALFCLRAQGAERPPLFEGARGLYALFCWADCVLWVFGHCWGMLGSSLDATRGQGPYAVIVAVTLDVAAVLRVLSEEPGLSVLSRRRLEGIVSRAGTLSAGVPVDDAAVLLGVSLETVRQWARQDVLVALPNKGAFMVSVVSLAQVYVAVEQIREFAQGDVSLDTVLECLATRRELEVAVGELSTREVFDPSDAASVFS